LYPIVIPGYHNPRVHAKTGGKSRPVLCVLKIEKFTSSAPDKISQTPASILVKFLPPCDRLVIDVYN
ncbi:MAG TPA: hypothetical protein PLT75_16475, partial [Spirochaetota bacterium]|nr:hypothetical protein [Spirochaetota bacterium]